MKDYESRENPDATHRQHRDHTNVPWASNTYSTRCLIPCGLPNHHYVADGLKTCVTANSGKTSTSESVGVPT